MKSLIFQLTGGLILVLAGWTAVNGANTLHVSSPSTGPGQGFTVSVEIRNSDPFTAFQFDLTVPPGFTFIQGTALLDASRSNGHQLVANLLSGNILRIAGYSQNNVPFNDTTGTILTFQLKSGMVPGNYPLSLLSPMIGDATAANILTGFTGGMVTLLAPDLFIPDTLINFDRTPLGGYTDRMLSLSNTGNQPLQILSIAIPSPWFSLTGPAMFSIPAGQSQDIWIRFNSQEKGTSDIPLTITCNDPDEGTREIALHARAYAVNELHTGEVFCHSGSRASLTFSVNNMEPLTGFQFDLILPAPLTYLSQSAVLTVRKTDHVISASLVAENRLRVVAHSPGMSNFTGNTGNIVNLSFDVQGTGGYYPLTLENVILGDSLGHNALSDFYNGNLILAAPDITGDATVDFGNVSVTDSASLTYQIRNVGSDTLKIDQITINDPSFFLMTPLPITLLPSMEGNVVIGFHRAVRGQVHGTMRIFSNDPDEYPYLVGIDAVSYVPNCILIPELMARYVDTVIVPIKINNLEPVIGFQFDLGIPSCMSYIPNSASLTARCPDHLLQAECLSGTQIRCLAYSPGQAPISGDTGAVILLKFTIHAPVGQSPVPLQLSGGVLGNVLSQNILWATMNGSIQLFSLPSELSLTGIIGAGQSECHNALQIVTVAGNGATFNILESGSATIIAGQKIRLLPGTYVESGGYLNGKITTSGQYCGQKDPLPDTTGIPGNLIPPLLENTFTLYPNPAMSHFFLEFTDGAETSSCLVTVYNLAGVIEMQQRLGPGKLHKLSMSGQRPGIYLVLVAREGKIALRKLVKQ